MRLALLGSKGFVGSRIAAEAMRRGWFVNHINSNTHNRKVLIAEADAVVHSVGSFMRDKRYKQLVGQPASVMNFVKLAALKLGLSPPNPLDNTSFEDLNFNSVKEAADAVTKPGIPFVFISAADWSLADPEYLNSKRKAEQYLKDLKDIRSVFLRPGFIAPEPASSCDSITPRHIVDKILSLTKSPYRIDVEVIAQAACDAVEDDSVCGVVGCEVLWSLSN